MTTAPAAPVGQHMVSRFLLKVFADVRGRVAVYEKPVTRHRHVSFGSKIFETTFDPHNPVDSEEMWGQVESLAGPVISRLRGSPVLRSGDAERLRDLVIVHWCRSRGMMVARDAVAERVVAQLKERNLRDRPGLLAIGYRQTYGVAATSLEQLEQFNESVHDSGLADQGDELHSDRNPVNFKGARQILGKWDVQLGIAPPGSEFIISDAPVITTKRDHDGVGPHQGVALGDADHVAMPITPQLMVGLGNPSQVVNLDPDAVRWYNELQWQASQRWIVCRPGGLEEGRMQIQEVVEELKREGRQIG